MKKGIKRILLCLVLILSVIIAFQFLPNKKLKENKTNTIILALFKEKDNGGGYEEVKPNNQNKSLYPSGYILNLDRSKCIDKTGQEIKDVMSQDGNNVKFKTKKAMKCSLFFDNNTFGKMLLKNSSNGLNSNLVAGLYRYQGTNTDVENYICFGTDNANNECTDSPETYMYRIIGVTEEGQVKVIKKTPIGNMQWHTNYTDDVWWYKNPSDPSKPTSILYTNLNGSSFYTNLNPKYVPETWKNMIVAKKWKYGDATSSTSDMLNTWTAETPGTAEEPSKIGLMYVYDYSKAGNNDRTNWMHLSNNMSVYNDEWEWTMTRYGIYNNAYSGFIVNQNGQVLLGDYINNECLIRPVFYLLSNVVYKSGDGTLDNPFIIK